jgi:PAS domain S-box-containing protein
LAGSLHQPPELYANRKMDNIALQDTHWLLFTVVLFMLASAITIFRLRAQLKKSQLKIANAEAEWTQAMDSLDYPMYLVDLDDRLVRANKAFYRQIGKSSEACVGEDIRGLIHLKGEDEPCPGCLARLEKRDAFFTKEADDPHNATGHPIEVTIKVIRDEQNKPIGVVQSIRDISHLRDTENSLRKSQAQLTEAQHIGHMGNWELDIKTNTLQWSDETYRIFGMTPDAVVPTYELFLEHVHPDDRSSVEAAVTQALETKETYSVDHRSLLPDGTVRHIHERGQVFCNEQGEPIRMIGVAQDVTDYKKTEDELRMHRDQLEELVAQRTTDLASARDQAQQASRAKSTFLATMSHELRTPLNAVIGFSELLMEDADTEPCAHFLPDLKKIHQSGYHLLRMINDILDISKIEAERTDLHMSQFSVQTLISDVLIIAEPALRNKGNQITTHIADDAMNMYGDPDRINQILLNIVTNAGKFTSDGNINLEVSRGIDNTIPTIYFRVSDTGIGMSEEEQSKIFQPFYRADLSTTSDNEGAGLGLAISERLCRLMGGSISVESRPNEGSTFTIKLPQQK